MIINIIKIKFFAYCSLSFMDKIRIYHFSLDGVVAVVEEMDLREHSDVRQPGGHWGSSVCLDYVELYSLLDNQHLFQPQQRNKLCGR